MNVSQLLTLDRAVLGDPVGMIELMAVWRIDEGLLLVLGLGGP